MAAQGEAEGRGGLHPGRVGIALEGVEQHALGVLGPDGGDHFAQLGLWAVDVLASGGLDLVAEVEAQVPAGHARIAPGQHGPVVADDGPFRVVHGDGAVRLGVAALVQVEAHGQLDVHAVLHAPGDELVEVAQLVLVHEAPVLGVVGEAQGREVEKHPREVEAVIGQELDVRLAEVGAVRA
jgi:hypothetical protein